MARSGAQVLIGTLIDLGVDMVFGYPGGAVLELYDELYHARDRIHHVLTAHEQGAAHAADGYARVTGKVGVVFATSGPGATNLVTGIANAYLDSVPLLAITGNVVVPLLGRDSFQEVDIIGITQPVVKHSYLVREVDALEATVREAFSLATTGRQGPVLIDLPKSVQAELTNSQTEVASSYRTLSASSASSAPSASSSLAENLSAATLLAAPNAAGVITGSSPQPDLTGVLEVLTFAKRPFLYLGGGVLAAGAHREAAALAERLAAPVGLSMMGMTALPHDHPLNLGMCGMHGHYAAAIAQSQADVILAAGVRFSDRATGDTQHYATCATVIHIDIDAAEIGKNVSPRIGVVGDVKEVFARLLDALPQQEHDEWLAQIEEQKVVGSDVDTPVAPQAFTPRNIIRVIANSLPPDTVVATDVGQHQMWVMQHYPFSIPRSLLTSGGLGAMGFGLGAAIGASVGLGGGGGAGLGGEASPPPVPQSDREAPGGKRVVLFTSDGSFGMNLNELATAVTQNLPLVIVILNNKALGMVRQWQGLFFGQRYSQTTLDRKTDFAKLAQAFGARGARVTSIRELQVLLADLPQACPLVIDCPIDPDQRVLPMIPPGGSVSNIITDEEVASATSPHEERL